MKLIFLFLFLFFQANNFFAAELEDTEYYAYYNESSQPFTFQRIWTENVIGANFSWRQIALILLSIQLSMIALFYIFARGFGLQNLEFYLKSEIYNYLLSLMLVLLIFSILDLTFRMGAEFLIGDSDGAVAKCLDDTLYVKLSSQDGVISYDRYDPPGLFRCNVGKYAETLYSRYNEISKIYKRDARLASVFVSFFGFPVFIGDRDVPGLHERNNNNMFLAHKILQLMLSLYGQSIIMKYIQANMLTFFLPVGLILRIMPITRDFGNFFIALSFSLFFIFPVAYVALDPSFARVDEFDTGFPTPLVEFTCFSAFKGSTSVLNNLMTEYYATSGLVESGMSSISGEYSKMLFQSQFLTFASLAITLSSIYLIMSVLGGDVSEFQIFVQKFV